MTNGSFAQGLVGITLDGRYRLEAVLGEGGMGSVFRATQLAMDRKVAVKLLKPHLTGDQAALQRFAREARATLKVDSPHAVKILDFGVTPLGDYYMVLEYLDGRTVHRELEIDGPFAPVRVAHIARQALHALGTGHGLGVIHRDVKPDNLLLMRVGGDADYTKILDFGVAKLMQGAAGAPSQMALTAAGMVFGTPEFMSPEQACGQALDGRSDLYSLAATMFVMLTGAALFEGKSAIELLTHHARTPAPHLAMVRPELAAYPELDGLLQRCLAKSREHRPAGAAEMAALLGALEPSLSRRAAAPPQVAIERAPTPLQTFHPSSYVEALRDAAPASTEATAPGIPRPSTASTANLGRTANGSRRRLYRGLGGAAIASLLGLGVGIALRRPALHSPSPPARDPRAAVAIVARDAPGDASVDAGAAPAVDAGAAPAVDAGAAPVPVAAPARARKARGEPADLHNASAEEHLRNAEDALRTHNQLRQLAEADLALRADPRSARAKYLLGDALIKSGDLDRGCEYLRALKRSPEARARASAAGCPGD